METLTSHLNCMNDQWEKLNVGVNITDNCDPNPLTSITVFSDEASLTHPMDPAVLARNYANPTSPNATVNGWDVTLQRHKSASKMCDVSDATCLAPNGRFYVVRVCSQDMAGAFNRVCVCRAWEGQDVSVISTNLATEEQTR